MAATGFCFPCAVYYNNYFKWVSGGLIKLRDASNAEHVLQEGGGGFYGMNAMLDG